MGAVRQRMRRVVAILAMLIAFALISAQTRAFAEVVTTCCCGHALPCKCPEHQPGYKPKHSDQPTMRPCGPSGQVAVAPELPLFDIAPIVDIAPVVTIATITIAVAVPAPAPDRAPPFVPI